MRLESVSFEYREIRVASYSNNKLDAERKTSVGSLYRINYPYAFP